MCIHSKSANSFRLPVQKENILSEKKMLKKYLKRIPEIFKKYFSDFNPGLTGVRDAIFAIISHEQTQ